jgi:hypothetical protein
MRRVMHAARERGACFSFRVLSSRPKQRQRDSRRSRARSERAREIERETESQAKKGVPDVEEVRR